MASWKHNQCCVLTPKTELTNSELSFIAKGSGIVSRQIGETHIIYYEGNLFGASNLHDSSERVFVAAGRLLTNYPTTAFCALDDERFNSLFETVGCVEVVSNKMCIRIDNAKAFQAWSDKYIKG